MEELYQTWTVSFLWVKTGMSSIMMNGSTARHSCLYGLLTVCTETNRVTKVSQEETHI